MEKMLTIVFLFASTCIVGQTNSGAIRLEITEKIKGSYEGRPVANQTATVVLNDSLKFSAKTDTGGYFPTIKNLQAGKYRVKVIRSECEVMEVTDIFVADGKTAYVRFRLTCISYINSLTKKEKKRFGYK